MRNRRPEGPPPGAIPPDQSAPLMVPSFAKLNELIQDLDKAAPPTLDDKAYPYEALSCVKYEEQDRFVGTRPFWLEREGVFFSSFFFWFFRIPGNAPLFQQPL